MIGEIKGLVKESCDSSHHGFGADFFAEHIEVVREVALTIGGEYQADGEVVEIAAYLHDIAAVLDPSRVRDHAELGSQFSREYLGKLGYPEEKIEKVANAIRFHSQPHGDPVHGLEALCIANADVISKAIRFPYWMHYAFGIRKLGLAQGKEWIRREIVEKAERVDVFTSRAYSKEIDAARRLLKTGPG